MVAATSMTERPVETVDSPESEMPMRRVRRRIDPQAGRALEILGHAIEYLTDEYMHEFGQGRGAFSASDGRLQAVQLLMAANRQVYFSCPEVEDLATRCLSILRGRRRKSEEAVAGPAGA